MWMIFGLCAIVAALLNLIFWLLEKEPKWFRFLSLSLTALTLCAMYSMDAQWVIKEDWSALMDVVPTMSRYLWGMVIASIAINSITLIKRP
mgnify:CR=1 FL=1